MEEEEIKKITITTDNNLNVKLNQPLDLTNGRWKVAVGYINIIESNVINKMEKIINYGKDCKDLYINLEKYDNLDNLVFDMNKDAVLNYRLLLYNHVTGESHNIYESTSRKNFFEILETFNSDIHSVYFYPPKSTRLYSYFLPFDNYDNFLRVTVVWAYYKLSDKLADFFGLPTVLVRGRYTGSNKVVFKPNKTKEAVNLYCNFVQDRIINGQLKRLLMSVNMKDRYDHRRKKLIYIPVVNGIYNTLKFDLGGNSNCKLIITLYFKRDG